MFIAVTIPDHHWTFSTYVKLRDRASYEFALPSAALCLRIDDAGLVMSTSLAMGGMVSKPWRSLAAAKLLVGKRLTEDLAANVAAKAYEDAQGDPKLVAVAQATVRSALAKAQQSRLRQGWDMHCPYVPIRWLP